MNGDVRARGRAAGLGAGVLLLAAPAAAAEIDSGNNAWILTSSLLVLMMIVPGLALFYGGLVRKKNVLSTLMHSLFCLALISLQWIVIGYSLAFAEGNFFVGGLDHVFLRGVDFNTATDTGLSQYTFMIFQGMFAAITPALISGAWAERMKFSAFAVFVLLWATLVYDPICHWVWGGGWAGSRGALDFAGGTVVHISSGVSALVVAYLLGSRKGFPEGPFQPHNLPMTVTGAALLWVGWFGFNAGSALAADGAAALAFVTTNTATAAAVVVWCAIEAIKHGKPTVLGAATAAVAGLVAVTPAAGFVSPISAMAIGAGAGVLCFLGVGLKLKLGYDDSLDVVGVHGVGGTWGAIATGIFASEAYGGTDGLLAGNAGQLWLQLEAVFATIVYAAVVSVILLKVIDLTIGLRVDEEGEERGLDLAEHSETAYES